MAETLPEELLRRFNVSRESLAGLECYVALLVKWQKRINLIGATTEDRIWHRHILDSLQLIPLLPPASKVIADLGSGAGIPGLILAIAGGLEAHLYESNARKVAFLREAARLCGPKAVIHDMRIEEFGMASLPQVDVVTARALAPLTRLLALAEPFLKAGAVGIFHKGKEADAELTEAAKSWRITTERHPSLTDSRAAILVIREAVRVAK